MFDVQKIKRLVNDFGFSLIPTDEKKIPVGRYTERGNLDEFGLLSLMMDTDSENVAIRLGSFSNGLMCLDLDEKNNKGFSARFFREFKNFFPELFEGMYIEKTPSEGFHFIYRVDSKEKIPTKFVGYRLKSEEEIIAERMATGKERVTPKVSFLEVRGELGLCQTFPSNGYTVAQDVDKILVVSLEQHEAITSFCISFNEVIPVEKQIKVRKADDDFYSENPYEHFNNSPRASEILKEAGWQFQKSSGDKDWYSKPERKGKDVDAWWNESKRFYNIFSANTGIDPKGYSPANLLTEIRFNGDKKACYAWLVDNGYGKIKSGIEKNIIKARIFDGGQLPKNISPEGLVEYEEGLEKHKTDYPFGIFWESEDGEKIKINMESFLRVSRELGFRNHQGSPVRIENGKILRKNNRFFFDTLKEYSKTDDLDILDSYERFLHTYSKTVILRLDEIAHEEMLRSSKYVSYKFFKNCYIEILVDDVIIHDYSELNLLIWEEDIQEREFRYFGKNHNFTETRGTYFEYIDKAIGDSSYLRKCIGFLTHDFRDTESYFILATEKCEDVRDGGGSGKSIFFKMLGLASRTKITPASNVRYDTSLMQSWDGEKIYCFGDMEKNFKLSFLKDMINGNAIVKKLWKDEFEVPVSFMPKFCGSSNYSFDDADPGIKRRVRIVEFTDFFTKFKGGVSGYFNGKMFHDDWDEQDYLVFDNYIISCIQEYMKSKCIIDLVELSEGGWAKKFDQRFTHIRDFIIQNIDKWTLLGFVSNTAFVADYELYCRENAVKQSRKFSNFVLNLALETYCAHHNLLFNKAASKRENSVVNRGKSFGIMQKEDDFWEDSTSFEEVPF